MSKVGAIQAQAHASRPFARGGDAI
jgi:hypothetical protein